MPFWTQFWVIVPPVVLLVSAFAIYFVRDAREKRNLK
jgi:heme/copper-type cytochrome/quinol oxidase subunit 2